MSLTKVSYSMINGAQFNVLDYGAAANGTTDDTAAIQAALNAAVANNGGTVYLPEGTYKVTSTLNIAATGVSLVGDGRKTTISVSSTSVDIIKIGGISTDVFRCDVKNLCLSGGRTAVYVSYNTAQCYLEELYITNPVVGIKIQGDYTTNPIKDAINHHIYKVEIEAASDKALYFWMCGDIYFDDIQTPSPDVTAYGVVIDSGVSAIYGSHFNGTGNKGGILITDSAGISPNPTSLPTTPRQMYFYQVQGDTCTDFGIQIENGYQITFVDSWGSGTTNGAGWVLGDGTDSIEQIALIGCRALGNSQDGFRWVEGNTNLGSQMIGCHALSNGYASGGTYDGINIQQDNSGLIVQGCNAYNDDSQGLGIYQLHGINIEGDVTNVLVTGNNLNNADGNTGSNLQYDSTTHTGNIITDNIGFNDEYFASNPSVPATTVNFKNPYARPMLVSILGGTVTAVKVDTITIATGTPAVFPLGPNHEVSITYSGAPNWSWVGM